MCSTRITSNEAPNKEPLVENIPIVRSYIICSTETWDEEKGPGVLDRVERSTP